MAINYCEIQWDEYPSLGVKLVFFGGQGALSLVIENKEVTVI
jgi:hypothetical protein